MNIPFTDVSAQIPSYAKFMKDIFSNKRKLVNYETAMLAKECSTILQNKLPLNLKDHTDSVKLSVAEKEQNRYCIELCLDLKALKTC